MKYNDRAYPYPVLGIENNVDGDFKININVSTSSKMISINVIYNLTNVDLKMLIDKKLASYCAQLYCRGTLYRKIFKTNKSFQDTINIESYLLNEQVETHFFICADNNIQNYSNSSFSEDFKGYSFEIEKGDILAYGGKGYFYANKSPEDLKSISAFMNIDTSGKTNVPMYNNYDSDKITILLSQEAYNYYQRIKNEKYLVSTLHSSIVLPSLIEAIRYIRDAEDSHSNKKWFDILNNLILNNETDEPLQTAQKILDLPINRSFSSLMELCS